MPIDIKIEDNNVKGADEAKSADGHVQCAKSPIVEHSCGIDENLEFKSTNPFRQEQLMQENNIKLMEKTDNILEAEQMAFLSILLEDSEPETDNIVQQEAKELEGSSTLFDGTKPIGFFEEYWLENRLPATVSALQKEEEMEAVSTMLEKESVKTEDIVRRVSSTKLEDRKVNEENLLQSEPEKAKKSVKFNIDEVAGSLIQSEPEKAKKSVKSNIDEVAEKVRRVSSTKLEDRKVNDENRLQSEPEKAKMSVKFNIDEVVENLLQSETEKAAKSVKFNIDDVAGSLVKSDNAVEAPEIRGASSSNTTRTVSDQKTAAALPSPTADEIDEDKTDISHLMLLDRRQESEAIRTYLHMKSLPVVMQKRVTVLKNIHYEYIQIEKEFYEESYRLEKQFQNRYQVLLDMRKSIVTGDIDPEAQEPKWNQSSNDATQAALELCDWSNVSSAKQFPEGIKGMPNFWYTVFRNVEILSDMMQKHDVPLIKRLTDIKIKYVKDDEHFFILEFHFAKNPYFTNTVLTKQYYLNFALNKHDPFIYDGSQIYKTKGCVIHWKKKMNITSKTLRRKQMHKWHGGGVRLIYKHIPITSFFNFFNPPLYSIDDQDIDDEVQSVLYNDFEVAHHLRLNIIPKAILYYTGDIVDNGNDESDK